MSAQNNRSAGGGVLSNVAAFSMGAGAVVGWNYMSDTKSQTTLFVLNKIITCIQNSPNDINNARTAFLADAGSTYWNCFDFFVKYCSLKSSNSPKQQPSQPLNVSPKQNECTDDSILASVSAGGSFPKTLNHIREKLKTDSLMIAHFKTDPSMKTYFSSIYNTAPVITTQAIPITDAAILVALTAKVVVLRTSFPTTMAFMEQTFKGDTNMFNYFKEDIKMINYFKTDTNMLNYFKDDINMFNHFKTDTRMINYFKGLSIPTTTPPNMQQQLVLNDSTVSQFITKTNATALPLSIKAILVKIDLQQAFFEKYIKDKNPTLILPVLTTLISSHSDSIELFCFKYADQTFKESIIENNGAILYKTLVTKLKSAFNTSNLQTINVNNTVISTATELDTFLSTTIANFVATLNERNPQTILVYLNEKLGTGYTQEALAVSNNRIDLMKKIYTTIILMTNEGDSSIDVSFDPGFQQKFLKMDLGEFLNNCKFIYMSDIEKTFFQIK